MSKTIHINPFPTTTYIGADYFCNGEAETAKMLSNIKNGQSTTLISIRRIGKTGLIKHVLGQLPGGWKGIYIDMLETENLNHFLNIFATAILKQVPEKSGIGKKLWSFIKSLKPVISFDPLSGLPQASFDVKKQEAEKITSKAFLKQYGLSTSATVLRSIKTLQDYELVYEDYDDKGSKYYSVYDVWLQRWSQQLKT